MGILLLELAIPYLPNSSNKEVIKHPFIQLKWDFNYPWLWDNSWKQQTKTANLEQKDTIIIFKTHTHTHIYSYSISIQILQSLMCNIFISAINITTI